MCSGLPYCTRSHGSLVPGRLRLLTEKPVKPALGLAPRPVAPSSRISPPAPVEAPGCGEIAIGWLCVSTFISTCAVSARAAYRNGPPGLDESSPPPEGVEALGAARRASSAPLKPSGSQRSIGPPSITAALSL